MDELIQLESLVLELLLIVSVVAILVRRFRIPFTVALVLVGFLLSFRSRLQIDLTPELILSLLLPPLVFEAAFHLRIDQLRRNVSTIALLAVPGVILTTVVVGAILSWGAGLRLELAMVFGALIAATDPVSVVAIFRKLGAPKRLEVLLESESLFNDGTAIVIFGLTLEILHTNAFSLIDAVVEFVRVGGGGVAVGLILALAVSRLVGRIDDHLVETTLTTVLAFGVFLVAEQFHLSGVLAVVTAGVVAGNLGEREMSPTTRIVVFNFWEYVAFLANSAVFLLIGLDIDLTALAVNWAPILWAIAAVLVSRAIGVYGLSRFGGEMPTSWRHVMFWGGLRGAIALALALSLPTSLQEERSTLIVMTFGVVLFTLLVQALTMEWLMKRLRLITRSDEAVEYERRHARAIAVRAGIEHLRNLHEEGLVSRHTWNHLQPVLQGRLEALTTSVQEALQNAPELEEAEIITARREALRVQRTVLTDLRRDGVITEETFEDLAAEVDIALDSEAETWVARTIHGKAVPDIRQLLLAVVQSRDLESVSNALANWGISFTGIQSVGGYLRQKNNLLIVGVPRGRLEAVVKVLQTSSQRRVEYVSSPHAVGGAAMPLPEATPVEVQGATVFAFDVERFVVI